MKYLIAFVLAALIVGCGGGEGEPDPCLDIHAEYESGITAACMGIDDCCYCDCWYADHYIPDPAGLENGHCICIPQNKTVCVNDAYDVGYDWIVDNCQ